MAEEEISVAVHPCPDGGFWAEADGCAGCITQADSYTAAIERLRDAHRAWTKAAPPVSAPGSAGAPSGKAPETAGRVAAWLVGAGWSCTKESKQHFVFVKTEPLVKVVVPKFGAEPLNSDYREALEKIVAPEAG